MRSAPWRRASVVLGAALLALPPLLQPAPARAQTPQAAELPALEPDGTMTLQAAQLVQLTLQRNPGLLVARMQAEAARRLADAERGLYTPTGFGRLSREGVDRPRTYEERTASLTNIEDASAIERTSSMAAGVRGRLPSGATIEISHEMRQRQSNLLATMEEREYRGTLSLSLKQPLLRGVGRGEIEADLRVAELEQQAERQRLVKQLLDTVGEAAGTYWQLNRADQTRQWRDRAVQSSRELQDEVRRRVDGGVAPRIELLEADTALGGRQTELVRAEQQLAESRARVRNLLNLDVGSGSGAPPAFRAAVPRPDGSAARAADGPLQAPPVDMVERWPGYQIARLRFEQESVRLEVARGQERPDLSANLAYQHNSLTSAASTAYDYTIRRQHPGWSLGLVFEQPLGGQTARSRREAQSLRTDAARVQMETEGKVARNEWSVRAGQLQAVTSELALLRQELKNREAVLAAEYEQYRLGRSRLRQLLEAQDRVNDNQIRLIDAEAREQLARISLQAISGQLLDTFGIRVND